MSWSINIPRTTKEKFIDSLADLPTPEQPNLPPDHPDYARLVEGVYFAFVAVGLLAAQMNKPYISGYISGHTWTPDQGTGYAEGISVSVSGHDEAEAYTYATS